MDTSLLQTRKAETRDPNGVTPPEADRAVDIEPPQYHDLTIDPAQPPVRLRLEPPIEFDGQQFKELVFDFDALIGKDFQRAERTFNKLYKADKGEVVLPEVKHLFHCILAAQVADVPVGLIMKLPRRYYQPLRLEVLKACGSSTEEADNE